MRKVTKRDIAFWQDSKGNLWDADKYSEAQAQHMSNTLINCADCINSRHCEDCQHCLNCIDCERCGHCTNCENCTDCFECEDCTNQENGQCLVNNKYE